MNVVFFPESYSERAPTLMGHLLVEQSSEWITLADVFAQLQGGQPVQIRQASAAELQRAEGLVALSEISQMLGEKLRELLDQEAPEETDQKMAALADAFRAIDAPSPLVAMS